MTLCYPSAVLPLVQRASEVNDRPTKVRVLCILSPCIRENAKELKKRDLVAPGIVLRPRDECGAIGLNVNLPTNQRRQRTKIEGHVHFLSAGCNQTSQHDRAQHAGRY